MDLTFHCSINHTHATFLTVVVDWLKSLGQSCPSNSGRSFVTPSLSSSRTLPDDGAVKIAIASPIRVGNEIDSDTTVLRNDKTGTVSNNTAWLTAEWCAALLTDLTFVVDGTEIAFSTRIGIAGILYYKSSFVRDWTRLYWRERESKVVT